MALDESRTLTLLKSLRADVIGPKITEYGGRIVGSAGDSLLVEFSSVVDAVQCAIEMQGRLTDANRDLPEDQRMIFRMGVNLGDVIADNDTIYGDGVNVAARLEKLAEPGSVCIARNVHDQVKGKLACSFIDLGEQRVHNIREPVHAFRVSSSPLIQDTDKGSPISSGKDTISVAILPFADMSRDQDQEYFADGLTEDLITELARSRQLSVVARNSTFIYKGKSIKAQEAGREFGAEFIVEGSVRKSGNQLRVAVQLIDCATGAHAWAERYDRKFEDIFALQDEIVSAIVARLAYNLEEAANVRRRKIPTASVTAYECFLRYRSAFRIGDEVAAREHALEAIRIDPNYARALGALAFLHSYEIFSRANKMPEADADRLSRDFAQRAVAADKSDSTALALAGAAFAMLGDLDRGRPLIEMAFAINPRDLEMVNLRGWALALGGQLSEGRQLVEWVNSLEPTMDPGYRASLCDVRYMARDYEGALAALDMIIDQPYFIQIYRAVCLAQMGRIDEAKRAIAENAPADYDPAVFARRAVAQCRLKEDKQHWLEGFRKVGIQV